jgi:hypothetical protein
MSTRSLRRLTLLLLLAGVAAYPQGLPLIAVLPLRAPESRRLGSLSPAAALPGLPPPAGCVSPSQAPPRPGSDSA